MHECDSRLQRTADTAVLAYPPKVDGDQQRGGQGNGDAVQNVEPIQGLFADEAGAEEAEAGIGRG